MSDLVHIRSEEERVAVVDRARSMLARARTPVEAKSVADLAKAAETYARLQQLGEEAVSHARAIYKKTGHGAHKRGECIRIGKGGAQTGATSNTHALWLTLEEAQLLALDLDAAIRRAKAFSPNYPPPEPPLGATAALPEAA